MAMEVNYDYEPQAYQEKVEETRQVAAGGELRRWPARSVKLLIAVATKGSGS
jgi:hypothetical protein